MIASSDKGVVRFLHYRSEYNDVTESSKPQDTNIGVSYHSQIDLPGRNSIEGHLAVLERPKFSVNALLFEKTFLLCDDNEHGDI